MALLKVASKAVMWVDAKDALTVVMLVDEMAYSTAVCWAVGMAVATDDLMAEKKDADWADLMAALKADNLAVWLDESTAVSWVATTVDPMDVP